MQRDNEPFWGSRVFRGLCHLAGIGLAWWAMSSCAGPDPSPRAPSPERTGTVPGPIAPDIRDATFYFFPRYMPAGFRLRSVGVTEWTNETGSKRGSWIDMTMEQQTDENNIIEVVGDDLGFSLMMSPATPCWDVDDPPTSTDRCHTTGNGMGVTLWRDHAVTMRVDGRLVSDVELAKVVDSVDFIDRGEFIRLVRAAGARTYDGTADLSPVRG